MTDQARQAAEEIAVSDNETLCKLYLELANVVPAQCVSSREFALRVDYSAEADACRHWKARAEAAEKALTEIKSVVSGHGTPGEKLGRISIITGQATVGEPES